MKIIVLPDSHSKPLWHYTSNKDGNVNKHLVPYDIANRRYDWFAQLVIDEIKSSRPGEKIVVIDLGDFADMKSLSSYDKNKRPSENERIQLDIDYARDARRRATQPVLAYINKKRQWKEKVPRVRFVALGGNHENRWNRLKNDEPLWDIFDSIDDISGAVEQGWELYPFLEVVNINGVNFCHYFESGAKRLAISGATPGRTLVQKMHQSCVAGHLHEYHVHRESTALGTCIGLVAGCYMEADEEYAGPQGNPRYWRGITVLEDVVDGNFNDRKIPLEHIKQRYHRKEQGAFNFYEISELDWS
jgi:hypothetical protein